MDEILRLVLAFYNLACKKGGGGAKPAVTDDGKIILKIKDDNGVTHYVDLGTGELLDCKASGNALALTCGSIDDVSVTVSHDTLHITTSDNSPLRAGVAGNVLCLNY